MGDLALRWDSGSADLAIVDDDLLADDGLETAVLISLFTDRRAEPGDALPTTENDLRGWWGDEFLDVDGDHVGSRLWLLSRSTRRPDVLRDAEAYEREALGWMIEDGVTDELEATAAAQGAALMLAITIPRPERDPVTFKYALAWDAEAA